MQMYSIGKWAHRLRIASWTGLVVALCAATAWGQTISPDQISRLSDPEYDVREAATRELLQDHQLKLDAVVEAYKKADDPEVRHRLLNVAQHCLVRQHLTQTQEPGEMGAIGIGLAGVLPRQLAHCKVPAVIVVSTSVGFPGNEYLQPNDLITQVNGKPLRPSDNVDAIRDEFIGIIETMRPNQMIELTVNRDGQERQISFALANKTDLQKLYTNPAGGDVPVRLLQSWMEIRRHIESAGQKPRSLNFRLPNARLNQKDEPDKQGAGADLLSQGDDEGNHNVTIIRRGGDANIQLRIEGGANGDMGLEVTEDLLRQLDALDPDSPNGKRVRKLLETIQVRVREAEARRHHGGEPRD